MIFQRSLSVARAVHLLLTFPGAPSPTLPAKPGTVEGKRGRVEKGRWRAVAITAALVTAIGFAGCSGTLNSVDLSRSNGAALGVMASESNPNRGTGDFKVGLILPLSASGNAGAAGQAM